MQNSFSQRLLSPTHTWMRTLTLTMFVIHTTFSLGQTSSTPTTSSLPKPASGAATQAALLPVDAAFPLLASFERGTIVLRIDVQPGHYLYRDRFEFSKDGEKSYSLEKFPQRAEGAGKSKTDPNFGVVKVFESPVALTVGHATRPKTTLVVTYQGCSEVAGVCYPPVQRTFEFNGDAQHVAAIDVVKPSGLSRFFKKP